MTTPILITGIVLSIIFMLPFVGFMVQPKAGPVDRLTLAGLLALCLAFVWAAAFGINWIVGGGK